MDCLANWYWENEASGSPLSLTFRHGSPDQFRHRPVIADQVLRAAGEVGELRAANIDSKSLIKRGEDIAEMDRPGAWLLAPAIGRAQDLAVVHAAAGQERAAN